MGLTLQEKQLLFDKVKPVIQVPQVLSDVQVWQLAIGDVLHWKQLLFESVYPELQVPHWLLAVQV